MVFKFAATLKLLLIHCIMSAYFANELYARSSYYISGKAGILWYVRSILKQRHTHK